MKFLLSGVLAIFFLTDSSIQAQEKASTAIIIDHVVVFDGEGILEDQSVKFIDGLIVSVSPSSAMNEDQKADRIDGNGKFLMPGLMNAHVHAFFPEHTQEAARAGVLSVFDMMGNPFSLKANKAAAENPSNASYFSAGYGATVPGGHGTQYGMPVPTIEKTEDIPGFVKDRKNEGVDYLKILYEPWRATFTPDQVQQLISEAHSNDLMAVTHISRIQNALEVAEYGGDGLVHTWFDRAATKDEIQQLAKSGIWIAPTLLTTKLILPMVAGGSGMDKTITLEELLQDVKHMHEADILLLAGTDPPNAEINYGTDLYKEIYLFKEAGLTNLEALKTATSNIATAFQLKDRGFIKPGLRADLLLINGNPLGNLEDIENIEMIWKHGSLVELN